MQLSGRLRFILETLQLLGIHGCGERKHLQRDSAAERDLRGFINHPHTSIPAAQFSCELSPSERRKRARALAQRFLTLLTLRPMRWATSGKLSPSRCDRIITSR